MPEKPRIFISSTINDFRDLRSALKYWLDGLGYEVMLSEYNDFERPLDKDTFNACIESVQRADYYVLLIGSRVGAFYDATARISVTRMEYRTAYELARRGKIKILVFVRKDLWTVRNDRQALKEFLTKDYKLTHEIKDSDIHTIVNHRSNIANDLEVTFSFLDEVSKNEEMKEAAAGKGAFPIANWIYPFSTFQDIIEALYGAFKISRSLAGIALRKNLRRELLSNLVYLTEKHDGKITAHCDWAAPARECVQGNWQAATNMPARYLRWLVMFAVTSKLGHWLTTQFIDQALLSGEFLEYDPSLHLFKDSAASNVLFQLRENVGRLKSQSQFSSDATLSFVGKYEDIAKEEKDVYVNNIDLLAPLGDANTQQNIVTLSAALIRILDGNYELGSLKLYPSSPLPSEAERMRAGTATIEEIADWIYAK
jgi:hypothetical protein